MYKTSEAGEGDARGTYIPLGLSCFLHLPEGPGTKTKTTTKSCQEKEWAVITKQTVLPTPLEVTIRKQ